MRSAGSAAVFLLLMTLLSCCVSLRVQAGQEDTAGDPKSYASAADALDVYVTPEQYRLDGICSWRPIERQKGISQLKYMLDLALGEESEDSLAESNNKSKKIFV